MSIYKVLFPIILVMLLSGCSESSEEALADANLSIDSTSSLDVDIGSGLNVANMGVVTSAVITVYDFASGTKGAQIGEPVTTNADGEFDFAVLTSLVSNPVMLVLNDPAGVSLYFNEAEARMLPFPADEELRAVVENLDTLPIAITPLTEVAVIMTESFVSDLNLTAGAAIRKANSEVSHAFLGGISPIYTIPVDVRKSVANSTNNAAVYANVLAGVAYVAQRNDRDPIAQADIYANNLLGNDTQLLQNDLADLVQAIASFNQSPPSGVFVPEISTNIAPVAYGQTVIIDEDITADITLFGGDLNRLPVMFAIETQPQFGRLFGTPPNISYVPDANFNGQDSFYFIVNNGFQSSERVLVNMLINPIADIPNALDSVLLTAENQSASGTLRASDVDGDLLTYTILTDPTHGVITSLNQDSGEFIYQPNLNSTAIDSFTYQVSDGVNDSNIASMNITVRNINNIPFATAQLISLNEDSNINITLAGTDTDGDTLVTTLTSAPVHGTLEGTLPDLVYTPDAQYNGQDSFSFLVSDGALNSTESVISLKVIAINDSPQALPLTLSLNQGESTSFNLNGLDPEQDTLTYTITQLPSKGALIGALSGSLVGMSQISYVPVIEFSGQDYLLFELNDGNGGTAVGTVTFEVISYALSTADSDGDGLRDSDEIRLGTSPILADTDGDGFSDFDEIITYAFDKKVNNFRFNPLLADVPEIDITLISQPDFQLNYTTTENVSQTLSTSNSDTAAKKTSHSKSWDSTFASSQSHEFGISVEVAKTFGGINTGVAVKGTVNYTNTSSSSHSKTTSWEDLTEYENSKTSEEGTSFEESNSIATSSGEISMVVEITNTGHLTYSLNNLYLSATYFDGVKNEASVPVGNLSYDDPTNSAFPVFSLAPGQSTGALNFKTDELSLNSIKRVMNNSKGMTVSPTIYDLLDQDGKPYNFSTTAIGSLDAQVMIDFLGNGGRSNVGKQVAVHGDPLNPISILDALNNVLNVNAIVTDVFGDPAVTGTITSVNGLANNGLHGFWIMLHAQNQGNNKLVTTTYTSPEDKSRWEARTGVSSHLIDNYDPSTIALQSGDILHLFYMQDSDLDGLSNVSELFYRTDINNPDSDSDGLDDKVEVAGWDISYIDKFDSEIVERVYSNPTISDSDGDELDDNFEANLITTVDGVVVATALNLRRNPLKIDTDGDGIPDFFDDRNSTNLFANEYDDLQISNMKLTVIDPNILPADVNITYTLPTIIDTLIDEGLKNYDVITYRYISTNGLFPEPLNTPKPGLNVLLGDFLSCNLEGTCNWIAIDIHSASVPGIVTIIDKGDNASGAIDTGETAKYISYARVDGIYHRMRVSKLASVELEEIQIIFKPGIIRGKRNVVLPLAGQFGTNVYDYIYYKDDYTYAYHPTETSGLYKSYDIKTNEFLFNLQLDTWLTNEHTGFIKKNRFPPLMHPLNESDGKLDIGWSLEVNSNTIVRIPYSEITSSASDNIDVIPSLFARYNSGSEVFPNTIISFELPALEGCHEISFDITEFDTRLNKAFGPINSVLKEKLCRGADAGWTILGTEEYTYKNNVYPLSYNKTLEWFDEVGRDTPINFYLDIGYDLYVR